MLWTHEQLIFITSLGIRFRHKNPAMRISAHINTTSDCWDENRWAIAECDSQMR